MIDLSQIEKGIPTALLIRHSEREHLPEKVHDITEPLNNSGEKKAMELGEMLHDYAKKIQIISSPVGRCIQTGKAILRGFGTIGDIIESSYLGEPGPFVLDRDKGLFTFTQLYSCFEVVELQCKNSYLDGFRTQKDGTEYLISYVCSMLQETPPDTLMIFISHDACLAPILGYYTGEIFRKGYWLDFLDGSVIQQYNDKFLFKRNGKSYEIQKRIC